MITFWGENHCSTKSSVKDSPSDESGFLKSGIPLPGPPVVLRLIVIPIWGGIWVGQMSVPQGTGLLDRFFSFPQIHSSSYLQLLSKTNSFHISIIARHRKGAGLAAGAFRVPIDSKMKLEADFVQALSKESL